METLFGKVAGDLAALVSEKWYAGMGLIGLLIFMWVLVIGTPHDDVLIGLIAGVMIGFGFGEAETRTFRQIVGSDFKITGPARKITVVSVLLYISGTACLIAAIWRAMTL
ncbi:hypothetical protein [Thioclava sp. F36-6]|uniref:hypothetical protein n=1 Tax=Thioclava sp. F36-6 TaxID=1915316 RepID=UPI0009972866|nr:hypothetical protein [Thioclava sp. F36-6]OOY31603.1 hypothetical protein BMI88_11015 [Thioclava sp. F36-6]